MRHETRIIMAKATANLVQSFDMAICGLLSFYFVKYFLADMNDGLISLFKLFSLAYLFQTIGSMFLGLFSDSLGRKSVFVISIIGMGVSTALIGLIPSHHLMGIQSLLA